MTDQLTILPRVIGAVAPHVDSAAWSAALAPPMQSSGITTPNRISMFIGQCAIESRYFEALDEDLFYSTAEEIWKTWPKHFADQGEAAPYIGRPEDLANRVYANRMGNGDAASGDGWRFRGGGLMQITGRDAYEGFGRAEPRARDPDWVRTMQGAAESACWFWVANKLNALSDLCDIPAVTKRVNGGLLGLQAREEMVEAALRVFGPTPAPPPKALALKPPSAMTADELDELYNHTA
jgi:putative chitinase